MPILFAHPTLSELSHFFSTLTSATTRVDQANVPAMTLRTMTRAGTEEDTELTVKSGMIAMEVAVTMVTEETEDIARTITTSSRNSPDE
jgi:hypothetical protein